MKKLLPITLLSVLMGIGCMEMIDQQTGTYCRISIKKNEAYGLLATKRNGGIPLM